MTMPYRIAAEVAQSFRRLAPKLIKLYHLRSTESLLPSLVSYSPEKMSSQSYAF